MMKLRINPLVAEDLKNIKEYIAEDNEEMAVKTIQEIYTRIETIQQFPYMGADLSKRVSFRTDYKYAISGNYDILDNLLRTGITAIDLFELVNLGFVIEAVTSHRRMRHHDEYACFDIKYKMTPSRISGITKISLNLRVTTKQK